MKWNKLTIETTTQAVDFISDMLSELGIGGIEIEDSVPLAEEDRKRMFIDILPELPEDDGTARIHCYLDSDSDVAGMTERIKEGIAEIRNIIDVGTARISSSETEDKDWINNWKEFFKPFRVDSTIVIKPTWEKAVDAGKGDLVIEIDPGTAFGTGAHETTRLCIQGLKKYLRGGDALLDVGCGSGILSIIGMKLGAGFAVGTDIDENAVAVAMENARGNALDVVERTQAERKSKTVQMMKGNIIDSPDFRAALGLGCYDMVAANILADVIIPLSAVIGEMMKPNAYFISSGIIDMKAEEVKQALLSNRFQIVETMKEKDWVAYVARKQ